MATPARPKRLPLALLASDQEWTSRSLETILGPGGYAVIRAYNARETLERARRSRPDLILLDVQLPDEDAFQVCAALRSAPQVGPSTPILLLAVGPATKQQRLQALRAGAWDVLGLPVDSEELLLRLEAYIRARVEADQAREEGLVDPATGLYNVRGLARRAKEMGSDALRHHTALACVVFGTDHNAENADDETRVLETLAQVFLKAGRVSDAIGRLGRTEFAVMAPGTNAQAAVRLAERLIKALDGTPETRPARRPRMRVGYEAVDNLKATPVEPVDLLVRATTALERARAGGNGERILRYAPRAGVT